jgi:hypothetical protein
MRIAYADQIPRLSHIATPSVPELIDYTLCGVRAVAPGPVLDTSIAEGWPDGAELAAPWCPICHQQAVDGIPRDDRIRYIGAAELAPLIMTNLEEGGLTVSWTPPKDTHGLIDVSFIVTGTRIATRAALVQIQKGLGNRGTILIEGHLASKMRRRATAQTERRPASGVGASQLHSCG